MNEVQSFEHAQFGEIRTVMLDGKVWFVLPDICKALHLSSPHKVANRLDEDEKGRTLIPTLGGEQNMTIVNESGLYAVILRSDKAEAKKFRKWITGEVLPSIQKHGIYMTREALEKIIYNPEYMMNLFRRMYDIQQQNEQLSADNARLTEKIRYLDIIQSSPSCIPITMIAKDYGISAMKMNILLNYLRIQYRMKSGVWVLYQEYADCGYTQTHTYVYDEQTGKTRMHTYWTQKGRRFLYEKLKEKGILPECEKEDADE